MNWIWKELFKEPKRVTYNTYLIFMSKGFWEEGKKTKLYLYCRSHVLHFVLTTAPNHSSRMFLYESPDQTVSGEMCCLEQRWLLNTEMLALEAPSDSYSLLSLFHQIQSMPSMCAYVFCNRILELLNATLFISWHVSQLHSSSAHKLQSAHRHSAEWTEGWYEGVLKGKYCVADASDTRTRTELDSRCRLNCIGLFVCVFSLGTK